MGRERKIDKLYKKENEIASGSNVERMLRQVPVMLYSDKFKGFVGGSSTSICRKLNMRETE